MAQEAKVQKAMAQEHFGTVEMAPIDPIIGLTELFRADPNPNKINLSIGVYQNDQGVNPVMSAVKQAERLWQEQENTKNYLGMAGEARYGTLVQELLFGAGHAILSGSRAATVHAPGGTGALRVGGDFLHAVLPQAGLWVSEPTWPNHHGVFGAAGVPIKTYPYYDPATHSLRFEAMVEALDKAPAGDVVLLHACCHNPSGLDPTPAQWRELADLCARRDLLPFFDFAYQGLGDGMEQDAEGLRIFADAGMEMLVASSFSKNFGLYRERVGALTVVAGEQGAAERVMSRLKLVVRANYSNPPAHGGKVVELVLTTPELRSAWQAELDGMRERIATMRRMFVASLRQRGVARNFDFLLEQKGMFSFSGITKPEVLRLRAEYGVYLLENGRINVAGMTPANMPYLCDSIATVLRG
jgi:aspartate/tyrosine/aromatic aminotransferase